MLNCACSFQFYLLKFGLYTILSVSLDVSVLNLKIWLRQDSDPICTLL